MQRAATTKKRCNRNSACNKQHCNVRKRQDYSFQMQKQQDRLQQTACILHSRYHATDSIATCNRQNRQHPMLQQGASTCNIQCCINPQPATRTTDRMQQTSCATDSIATDTVQPETALQQTACILCSRYHAIDSMQHATENMQRTAVVP